MTTAQHAEIGTQKDIRQGAEIAIEGLKAAGSMNSFLFELVVGDGACSSDQGAAVSNKFAADPVMAVIGGTCSGETFGPKLVLHTGIIAFRNIRFC
ncbi:MAG: hypothetical protein ACK4WM_03195 [Thermoflexales bacterium]